MEKVPLAAEVLDVRQSQKLRIIDRLKLERQRVRFEAEIGKAPPLSDDELAEHIREEAYVTTFVFASVNSRNHFLAYVSSCHFPCREYSCFILGLVYHLHLGSQSPCYQQSRGGVSGSK